MERKNKIKSNTNDECFPPQQKHAQNKKTVKGKGQKKAAYELIPKHLGILPETKLVNLFRDNLV